MDDFELDGIKVYGYRLAFYKSCCECHISSSWPHCCRKLHLQQNPKSPFGKAERPSAFGNACKVLN
jgi:hypothetical protein